MTDELKHPNKYWTEYKATNYGSLAITPKRIANERKAFHAGIEAAFDFFLSLDTKTTTSKQIAEDLRWFHRHNQATIKAQTK